MRQDSEGQGGRATRSRRGATVRRGRDAAAPPVGRAWWVAVGLVAGCSRDPVGASSPPASATGAPPPPASVTGAPPSASATGAPPPSIAVTGSPGAASAPPGASTSEHAGPPRLVLTSEPTGAVVYRDDPARPPLCTTPCDVPLADAAPGQTVKLIFTVVNRKVVIQTLTLKAGVTTLAVTVPALRGK